MSKKHDGRKKLDPIRQQRRESKDRSKRASARHWSAARAGLR